MSHRASAALLAALCLAGIAPAAHADGAGVGAPIAEPAGSAAASPVASGVTTPR